eukprot:scaffold1134_cov57-Phaeocystis_antarctica.AAC.8
MVNAQVDQHPLARATETSPKLSSGTLSCLSAQHPDLANRLAAQPEVAFVRPALSRFYTPSARRRRDHPRSRYGRRNVTDKS